MLGPYDFCSVPMFDAPSLGIAVGGQPVHGDDPDPARGPGGRGWGLGADNCLFECPPEFFFLREGKAEAAHHLPGVQPGDTVRHGSSEN